ncbi:BatA domain-containing protein [Adhaeribacter radiodurans]|uniref:BatA domain-containing protein n=1 Tax=Adhaeribacter radiodurans TaxID=2745197 RepID=A0A7L7LBZ1_9BACT|nr:BatA domain-containing protein [Adhaeribacter radiodurans]QMU30360.1 BatA domain-containing protein [Adhaeribacter radiodurans]
MSFLFPTFLYGLLAVSIPIVIHLIELRRAKHVFFTNLKFIKEVKSITASHRRLKQWLILLARICFIISLVLLFSQPYLSNGNKIGLSTNRAKVFIDNSFSMQNEAKIGNNTLLQTALDQTNELTKFFNVNSSYQISTNSKFSYTDLNKSNFQKQVGLIKEAVNSRSLHSIFSWFNQEEDRKPFKGFLFSDFQKSIVKPNSFQIPDNVNEYYLVPIQSSSENNLLIDTVYSEDVFIRQNEENALQVRVRNAGITEKDCQVKFFIDNKQVSALSVNVPPNRTVPFTLNYRLSSNNMANCRIVIEDFPVTFDNTFYFILKPSESIKILEINSNNLIGNNLFTNENIFRYTASSVNNINYKQINQADLIVLNSINDIDAPLADNLRSFVQDGGNILIIPGDKVNYNSYQSFLAKLQLSNVQLVQNQQGASKSLLAYPEIRNPFFQNIFSEQNRNTILPQGTRLWRWNRSASDILSFKEGGSFLSSFRLGNGQIYMFASPLTEAYSDFQNHALFVPVMYKIGMLSSREQQPLAYSMSNRILTIPFKQSAPADQIVQLRKDSTSFIPEQQVRKNELVLGIPAEANEAGFYELIQKDSVLARLAFNFDKKESFLKQYTVQELQRLTAGQKNIHVINATNQLDLKKELTTENLGVPLWKYCLILCLVFMFTEILLIRYF